MAAAAYRPDEAIAAALHESADLAVMVSGYASAASAYERAAQLEVTADGDCLTTCCTHPNRADFRTLVDPQDDCANIAWSSLTHSYHPSREFLAWP
jgi:hypothetical protein